MPKGKRKGFEMEWESFVTGDEALAAGLATPLSDGPIERDVKAATVGKKSAPPKRRKR